MVLAASLVLCQRSRVLVEAQQGDLVALAPGDGVCDGRAAYYQALVLDT